MPRASRRDEITAAAAYRRDPEAFTVTVLNTSSFHPSLPPGFQHPVEIVGDLMAAGQRAGVVREGSRCCSP
ncbi:hypothetical protein V5P93_005227 [Actinokineospora auranticolor]|uniref:Uncharacterized protein n=1 Tax=Actinokineospora auranticolor TaxID=155976 RepID=A0A2S6GCW2_9PSEU|nr:hypothetical protein [Actinokineospora auranticolor]PPK63083.1 hypothetical protein CLV40_13216 [Actinokineospora auranticolor]